MAYFYWIYLLSIGQFLFIKIVQFDKYIKKSSYEAFNL